MERADLERLSKNELIELVLRLQRPQKTSRTASRICAFVTLNRTGFSGGS